MNNTEPTNLDDNFGDYIVFVDESGDQSLTKIYPKYPIFVLAFCIFEKRHYIDEVVPNVLRFKFDFFGSDITILHEREIRKAKDQFSFLQNTNIRERFFSRLNMLIDSSRFTIVSTIINKCGFAQHSYHRSAYSVGTQFGLERVFYFMQDHQQRGKKIPIIFESRGAREDSALQKEFERIVSTTQIDGIRDMFEFHCVSKKANLPGLQLADLVARPIGNHYLFPAQKSRSWDILQPKLRTSRFGDVLGYGIKIFPVNKTGAQY